MLPSAAPTAYPSEAICPIKSRICAHARRLDVSNCIVSACLRESTAGSCAGVNCVQIMRIAPSGERRSEDGLVRDAHARKVNVSKNIANATLKI